MNKTEDDLSRYENEGLIHVRNLESLCKNYLEYQCNHFVLTMLDMGQIGPLVQKFSDLQFWGHLHLVLVGLQFV